MSDASRPWLDTSLPVEERVDALLAVMTLEEKVGQTHQVANVDAERDVALLRAGAISSSLSASGEHAGNTRDEGVQASLAERCQRIAVEESRLGIPLLLARDVIHGHRTVCPIPLGQAAAWDPDLLTAQCEQAAQEAATDGIAWTFAPMVDICEDPRWGRIAEGFGESPVLSGHLAAAAVRGFQGADADRIERGSIVSTLKHFCGYGLATGGRDYESVQVVENTLRNLHLRPFRAGVDAGAQTVMASFNDIDGTPMHANAHLLRDVLKGEWGFDGFVVADWEGVGELADHGVAESARDAARQGMLAGVDMDMVSGVYSAHLADLVRSGEVPEEVVDDAVRRVLRVKFRAGLFEDPYPRRVLPNTEPSAESRKIARRAALGAMVLVKNQGVLPLSPEIGKLHLGGPFVDSGDALLGTWVLDGREADVVTPVTALSARLGERLLVTDGRFSDQAMHHSRWADATVLLLGEHPSRSGEANSVSDLGLPAGQLEVLRQQARLGKPLVAVVYTGRPLDLDAVLDLADAVLVVFHPGVEAGPALDAVLFGDAEPAGRLPVTFPRTGGHVPYSHHARRTSRVLRPEDDPTQGRYLDALTVPRLPFGYGLSYTSFEHAAPRVSASELARDGAALSVTTTVTNTGPRRGRELVQLYFTDPVAEVTRPWKELADWAWVDLEPGERREVGFEVTAAQFGYTGRGLTVRVDPGAIVLSTGPDAEHLRGVDITIV